MLIDTETYKEIHKTDTYDELIKERDFLIREIKIFEKNRGKSIDKIIINPSPEIIYSMNLEYLAVLCELIKEKFCVEND